MDIFVVIVSVNLRERFVFHFKLGKNRQYFYT